jgi:hypothetical protein
MPAPGPARDLWLIQQELAEMNKMIAKLSGNAVPPAPVAAPVVDASKPPRSAMLSRKKLATVPASYAALVCREIYWHHHVKLECETLPGQDIDNPSLDVMQAIYMPRMERGIGTTIISFVKELCK